MSEETIIEKIWKERSLTKTKGKDPVIISWNRHKDRYQKVRFGNTMRWDYFGRYFCSEQLIPFGVPVESDRFVVGDKTDLSLFYEQYCKKLDQVFPRPDALIVSNLRDARFHEEGRIYSISMMAAMLREEGR